MALLDPLHPLQSGIVETLAAHQELSIHDVMKHLEKDENIDVSLPNLYRTVGQMIEAQMLVKHARKITLNRAWIPHLLAIADALRSREGKAAIAVWPLKEGERREYAADSLGGLDPVWFDVLAGCADGEKTYDWYAYNSHPWHIIGMSDTELRGYKALTEKSVTCHMVYGNDTFLDRYALKLIAIKNFHASINAKVPLLKEGYALWICDEHIIECLFPEILSERFRYFFANVRSIGQFDPALFADIFRMKARCKVTLRRSKKEAAKLRAMLKEYV